MPIPQLSPEDAQAFLDTHPDACYVDVRTPGEFAAGHPQGAINIPLFLSAGGMMQSNAENFTKVAKALLPTNKPFVIGCQAGGRSQKACEFMTQLGYAEVYNVAGGFGAWLQSGLPAEAGSGEAASYDSLLKKADAGA